MRGDEAEEEGARVSPVDGEEAEKFVEAVGMSEPGVSVLTHCWCISSGCWSQKPRLWGVRGLADDPRA